MLSVVICTHNPRPAYLKRTLAALRAQSLSAARWELLLIDNASATPVTTVIDLAWHPLGRILAEPTLGLTPARLLGIAEAHGDILVFVDDDNLLARDYLERTLMLARSMPSLGVWGCGTFQPEWEQTPPPEYSPYLAYLAVRQVPANRRSVQAYDYAAMPPGAGLCVRAEIARHYAESVRRDPRRKLLGRTGAELNGCEDFDLALTAIDLGRETAIFRELAMTHLMPRERVEEPYLLRLVEGHARSMVLLMTLRGDHPAPPPHGLLARLREYRLRRSLGPIERRIHDARRRGEMQAWAAMGKLSQSPS
jgi:glycosyltransferase involved in cell wall biosynthesis